MKRSLLALLFVITSLTAVAQEQVDTSLTDTLIKAKDTIGIPVLKTQEFYNYKLSSKLRLDSIENIVPLSYNEFVQQYIDIYTSRKSMIGKMLGLSAYYFPIFEKALKAYNIPDEIKYLPVIESEMDPSAVSKHGATGLWQFMFATARGYGLGIDNFEDQRKDPIEASYAAAAYFRDAYDELGDWLLALAAYNCGKGNVTKAMNKANSRDFWEIRPFLPAETRNYVPAFIAALYTMKFAAQHQIEPLKSIFANATDTIFVNRFVSLPALAGAMHIDEGLITALNPSYKRKIVNGTPLLSKRIVIPQCDGANYAAVYEILNNSEVATDTEVILAANTKRLAGKRTPNAEKEDRPQAHKVRPGENLSGIADRYGITVQDLKVWNQLKSNTIVPNQKLKITSESRKRMPAPTEKAIKFITYKVKPGDTLSEIAEKFDGASVSTIKRDNDLKNAKLQEGMLLKIFKG